MFDINLSTVGIFLRLAWFSAVGRIWQHWQTLAEEEIGGKVGGMKSPMFLNHPLSLNALVDGRRPILSLLLLLFPEIKGYFLKKKIFPLCVRFFKPFTNFMDTFSPSYVFPNKHGAKVHRNSNKRFSSPPFTPQKIHKTLAKSFFLLGTAGRKVGLGSVF